MNRDRRLLRFPLLAALAIAIFGASCKRSVPTPAARPAAPPVAKICQAQTSLPPGVIYHQSFEADCHDWFTRDSEAADLMFHDSQPDPLGLKAGTFTAESVKRHGAYYSSWLNPIPVNPGQTYCLDLWAGWPAGGAGLTFGIRRLEANQVDLRKQNVLMGPAGMQDPEMGPVVPIAPNQHLDFQHLRRSFVMPPDTHFIQIFANIDWTSGRRYQPGDSAGVDEVKLSVGECGAPPAKPMAPTGLMATPGNAQVGLGWNAVSGATSYTVKRATSAAGPFAAVMGGTVTGTSFTNTGLTNGTPYFFVVSASNAVGEGLNSGAVSATPTAASAWVSELIPSTITPAGTFTPNGETITVSAAGADIWSTADQFRFTHKPLTGDGTITARLVSLCGGTPGTCPNAWTKAGVMMRDGNGTGARNVFALVSPTATNKYRMQYRSTTGGTTTAVGSTPNSAIPAYLRVTRQGNVFSVFFSTDGSTFTQIGMTQNIAMPSTIRVGLAITSHASSLATAVFDNITITTPPVAMPPPAPTGLTCVAGNNQCGLSWGAVAGATSYTVKRAPSTGGPYTDLTTVMGTSWTDATVTNGMSYVYVVSASNAAGQGPISNEVSCSPAPPPPVPTAVMCVSGNNRCTISWAPVMGATSYRVKRSMSSGGPYDLVGSGINAIRYTDTTAMNGSPYFYVVTSVKAGIESPSSAEVSCAPSALPPSAPMNLMVAGGVGRATLSWTDTSNNETQFKIERRLATESTFVEIATIESNVTTYLDTSVPGGTHEWRVRASNPMGDSDYSNVASAMVIQQLPAPTGLAASPYFGEIRLRWNAVSGATGYRVKRATTSGGPYLPVPGGDVAGTTFTDTSVTNWISYYYVVAALQGGVEGAESGEVKERSFDASSLLSWLFSTGTVDPSLTHPPTFRNWPGIDSSGLRKSAALTPVILMNQFTTDGWPTGGIDLNKYLEVPVTAATGFKVSYDSLRFQLGGTLASGAWQVRSSVDNFAAPLAQGSYSNISQTTIQANLRPLGDQHGTVTFRIYLFANSGLTPTRRALLDLTVWGGGSISTTMPPGAPTGLSAVSGDGQCVLSWSQPFGAASQTVKRATRSGGPYAPVPTVMAGVDDTVVNGQSYFYVVSASNAGGEGPNSAEAPCNPQVGLPLAPANVACVAGNGRCTLTWDAVPAAVVYRVRRAPVPGAYTTVELVSGTTFIDVVANDTTYLYRVDAIYPAGLESKSAVVLTCNPVSAPPAAPSGLTAMGGVNQATLSWTDNSSNETQFKIERKLSSQPDTSFAPVGMAGANATTFTDAPLMAGMYTWRVRSSNAAGDSGPSNSAPATVSDPVLPPPPPPNFVVVGGVGQATLTWTDSSNNETQFQIQRKLAADPDASFTQIATPGANATMHLDSPLAAGMYTWRLRASNMGGSSAWVSASATVTAHAWVSEDIPSTLLPMGSYIPNGGTFSVTASGTDIWSTADQFRFTHIGLTGDGTITARVATLCGGTPGPCPNTAWTKAGVMMRDGTAPGARNIFALLTPASTNKFRMQVRSSTGGTTTAFGSTPNSAIPAWLRITRAGNNFSAFYSTDGNTFTQIGGTQALTVPATIRVGLALTSHTAGQLAAATFDNVSVTTPAPMPPPAPSNLLVTGGAGQATLSWTDNSSNETQFKIERKLAAAPDTDFVQIDTVGANVTSYVNGGLAAGMYTWRVRANNAAGDSGYSNSAAGTVTPPPMPPAVPTNLVVTGGVGQATLTWTDNSSDETQFKIERKLQSQADTAFTQVGMVGANTTNHVDMGLAAGVYTWRVRASNAVGDSAYSNTRDATVTALTPPSPPSNLLVTGGVGQATLTWTDNSSNETQFKIERKLQSQADTSFMQIAMVGANVTTHLDTGLPAGTYTWRVRANNAAGDSAYSNTRDAVVWAPLTAPTGLVATPGNRQVSLSWNAVTSATVYLVERALAANGPYEPIIGGTHFGTSVADTNLTNGVTYHYRVSAYNGSSGSPSSGSVPATPGGGSGWVSETIPASLTPGGTWSDGGATITMSAAGADIWSTADQFRFTHQALTGDGTITARVATLCGGTPGSCPNAWTKVGVMMRDGTAPGAANVAAILSPTASNRYRMQVRSSAGGMTVGTAAAANSAVPAYLRVTRAGNTFTAFYSTNGTTFTQIGSQSVNMGTTIRVGLGLTSHNTTTLATATFSNITITSGSTLPAPTGLVATSGDGHVSLAWNAVTNASRYIVKRATATGGPYTPIASNVTGTGYLDFVASGSTVYYVVSAKNDATESANSSQVTGAPSAGLEARRLALWGLNGTMDSAVPRVVTQTAPNVLAGNLTKSATLTSSGSLDSQFTAEGWPRVSPGVIDTNKFFEFSVTPASGRTITMQWIRFSIFGEDGPGSWELRSSADSFAAPIAQGSYAFGIGDPAGLDVQVNVSALGIRSSTTTFRFYSYDNEGWPPGDNNPANFRRGFRGNLHGGKDLTIWGKVGGPPAPSGLEGVPGDSQAYLTWNAVSGATGYTIKRATDMAGPFTMLTTTVVPNYLDTGLINQFPYFYVVASNDGSSVGPDSAAVKVTPWDCVAPCLASWSIPNGQLVNSANPYPPLTSARNTVASDLTKSTTLTPVTIADAFVADNWPGLNAPVDLSKYLEFSVTALPGRSISYTSLQSFLGYLSSGQMSYQIRTSVDNFATVLESGHVPPNIAGQAVQFGASLGALGTRPGTVTFRFYVFNSHGSVNPVQRGFVGGLHINGTVF
jgi:predicted phage tail protein/regulation of enolase protein 1 (concanavalin A-like superfamily)